MSEANVIKAALNSLSTNVGARPRISESYMGDYVRESKVMEYVTNALRSNSKLWDAAKSVASRTEREFGGIWGCFIGVELCTLSMMGGKDHIALHYGALTVIVFKRS